VQLATIVHQPVPSMPANLESNTKLPAKSATEPQVVALKKAPVTAQQPTGEEVVIDEVVTIPPKLIAQNVPPAQSNTTQQVTKLPKTASRLPWAVCVGVALIAAGSLLRFLAFR
jgi:hypothetical protein